MPSRRTVITALVVGFMVSIVHYVDNTVNYDDYPQGHVLGLPPPPLAGVVAAWLVFTAVGTLGLRLLLRGQGKPAAWLLGFYAGSGLLGVGHYLVDGSIHMAWWRQLHVCADIVCGALILALAVQLGRTSPCTRKIPTELPLKSKVQ